MKNEEQARWDDLIAKEPSDWRTPAIRTIEFLQYAKRPMRSKAIGEAVGGFSHQASLSNFLGRLAQRGLIRKLARGVWTSTAAILLTVGTASAGYFANTVNSDSMVMQAVSGAVGGNTFVWSGAFDAGRQRLRGTETLQGQTTVAPALIDCRPLGVRIPPARVVQVTRWSCLYRLPNETAWEGPYLVETPDGLR
jgi:hypothetical protein